MCRPRDRDSQRNSVNGHMECAYYFDFCRTRHVWGEFKIPVRDEVRRSHPEGMSAISRGLSVRDTPGAKVSELRFAS